MGFVWRGFSLMPRWRFWSDWLRIRPELSTFFFVSQALFSFIVSPGYILYITMPQTRSQRSSQSPSLSADAPTSSTTTIATSLNLQQYSYTPTTTSPAKSSVTRTKVTTGRITKAPKKRSNSSYAPPAKYAHLNELADAIDDDILCLMVGHNPGVQTAKSGHACMFLVFFLLGKQEANWG
jgi:hypothetical protein